MQIAQGAQGGEENPPPTHEHEMNAL
jgi:hypothetical protein